MRIRALADVLYPRFCFSCDVGLGPAGRRWLCARCLARIDPVGVSPCPVCSGELGPTAAPSACTDCRRLRPRFDAAVAVGKYRGVLRELIPRLKYAREASLAWPLGELLVQTLSLWPRVEEAEVVTPMPLGLLRRVKRGFNQAELLAEEAARGLGLPLLRHGIARRGRTPPQAGLSRTDRLTKPRGTMRVRPAHRVLDPLRSRLPAAAEAILDRALPDRIRGRSVLLVDDVLTTGASASEAARALKEAGARSVLVAVLARA